MVALSSSADDALGPSRPRRGALRATALGVSALLHGAFLLGFLIHISGGGLGGGQYNREVGAGSGEAGIEMSLVQNSATLRGEVQNAVAASAAKASHAGPPSPDALQTLLNKATADAPTAAATQPAPTKPASLDALIAQADRRTGGSQPSGAKAASGGKSTAGANAGGTQGGRPGELFAQVEPCWKRALGHSTTPVSLQVVLDGSGRMVGAPRIAKVGDADREAKRIATERALQAVAACLPYRPAIGGSPAGAYSVDFGVSNQGS